MKCKKCGNVLHESDKFCPNCGEVVESKEIELLEEKQPFVLDKINQTLLIALLMQIAIIICCCFYPHDPAQCPKYELNMGNGGNIYEEK